MVTLVELKKLGADPTGLRFEAQLLVGCGKPFNYQVRQTGKIQTWKRNPERFLIPVRYGLKDNFYIANFQGFYKGKVILNNSEEWNLFKTKLEKEFEEV